MKNAQNGQALVEFALTFVLLAMILAGIFDLGRAFHATIAMTNAARAGARYATLHVNLNDGMSASEKLAIQTASVAEASANGITLTNANIDPICPSGCDTGNPIRVTVNYDLSLVLGWVIPSPVSISRYIEMEIP